jgi:hypothetical protein
MPISAALRDKYGFTCTSKGIEYDCKDKCIYKASGSYSGAAGVDSKIKTTSSPCTE